jgi:pimeloyl-ACP methyl ester carboxylesterase
MDRIKSGAVDAATVTNGKGLSVFAYPGTTITEKRVAVDDTVSLRVVEFRPAGPHHGMPVVLVPGLTTVMESFRGILQAITKEHVVHYVETREKPSSHTSANTSFDMAAFGQDVAAAIEAAGLPENGYLLAGYSLGATAIMQGYAQIGTRPAGVVLAEPVPHFRFPSWSIPLVWIAVPVFGTVRAFAKWYMRRFMINTADDMEVMRIVERALDSADPVKLKKTVLSINGYRAWDRLGKIDRPTLVVATSKDTLHTHDDIVKMASLIPDSELIDMEDNTKTHSAEMAGILEDFISRSVMKQG